MIYYNEDGDKIEVTEDGYYNKDGVFVRCQDGGSKVKLKNRSCDYNCNSCCREVCVEYEPSEEEVERSMEEAVAYIEWYNRYFENHGDVPYID